MSILRVLYPEALQFLSINCSGSGAIITLWLKTHEFNFLPLSPSIGVLVGSLDSAKPRRGFPPAPNPGPTLGLCVFISFRPRTFPLPSHCNCFPSSVPQGPQGLTGAVRTLPPSAEPHLLLADSDFLFFHPVLRLSPQLRFCHSYHLLDNRDVFSFAAFSCGGPQRPALSTGDISFGHLVKMPDLFTAYSVFSLLVVMNEINEPSVGERSCNFFL